MALIRPPVSNVWGNAATSSPDMATPTYIDTGFPAPGGVPVRPPRGFVNWLFNYLTNAARYLSARGIADWDATETQYTAGAKVVRSGQIWALVGTATPGTAPEADLTNWQMWVDSPIAHGPRWTPIVAWRNSSQQRVFGVSYNGFPGGDIIQWDENWLDLTNFSRSGTTSDVIQKWQINITGAGATFSVGPQYDAFNPHNRYLRLSPTTAALGGAASAGRTEVQLVAGYRTTTFTDDAAVEISWSFSVPTGSPTGQTWIMGFACSGQAVNSIADGAYFFADQTVANWQVRTVSGGTASSFVDTGVLRAPGTSHTASIALIGANRGAGIAKATFAIDGVEVGEITTNLPYTTGPLGGTGGGLQLSPIFGNIAAASGSGTVDQLIGPLRYRQTTRAGDVF